MWRRQPLEDVVLGRVQVLTFVHQQVVPLRRHLGRDRVIPGQEIVGQADEIVEVRDVPLAQRREVALEQALVAGRQLAPLEPPAAEQRQDGIPPLAPHA